MKNALTALWEAWAKEDLSKYPPVPNGKVMPIVVTRWVRNHPECLGWKDWNAAGVVDDGRVVWMVPEEKTHRSHPSVLCAVTAQQDIALAVAAGRTCGTVEYQGDPYFHLQWRIM